MTSDLKKKNINYEIQMQISDYAQCYVLCINDNSSKFICAKSIDAVCIFNLLNFTLTRVKKNFTCKQIIELFHLIQSKV